MDYVPDNVDEYAKQEVGLWARNRYFFSPYEPDPPDEWARIDFGTGDELIDRANEESVSEILLPFDSSDDGEWDWDGETGLWVKPYGADGEVTAVFVAIHELMRSLSDYPILDDALYSHLEIEQFTESWESWGYEDVMRQPGGPTFEEREALFDTVGKWGIFELYKEVSHNAYEMTSEGPALYGASEFAAGQYLRGAVEYAVDVTEDKPLIDGAYMHRWLLFYRQCKEEYSGSVREAMEDLADFYSGYEHAKELHGDYLRKEEAS